LPYLTYPHFNFLTYFWRPMRYLYFSLFFLFIASCRPPVYTPKPPGYYLIDTPANHEYRLFNREGFPYSFEYPIYSDIENDTVFQGSKEKNPYWINIYFPKLGGVINITYREISDQHPFNKLVQDAYGLSFFHHEKADYIDEHPFIVNGISCTIYTVGGNAATRYQFTATDSVKHFMRGALYFDTQPNADSLKPATEFLVQDIVHLLTTLRFK
jgi:gliding motility-associated lipoprotein GldD